MVIKNTELEPCQKPPEAESPGLWPRNMHFINLPQTMLTSIGANSSCEMSSMNDLLLVFEPFIVSKPHTKSQKPHFLEVYQLKGCQPKNAAQ